MEDSIPAEFETGGPVGSGGTRTLDAWLDHLSALLITRIRHHLRDGPESGVPAPPDIAGIDPEDPLSRLAAREGLNPDEVLILVLALAPLLRPDLFDRVVSMLGARSENLECLGGVRGRHHRGLLPTGDTALWLLSGDDLAERLRWLSYLSGSGAMLRDGLITLDPAPPGEPPMSGQLCVNADLAESLLTGRNALPVSTAHFPARPLVSGLGWDDLILPTRTRAEIDELLAWIRHGPTLLDDWGMRARLRPGCRILFTGPPGTGKTLTAALLGQATDRPVLRVDLSMIVSKYIGDTEKNLAGVFDRAENKDWILFFDEADALFGKRSAVKDARDRYANQEISFLLQRIEVYSGVVVLASNLTGNVDSAFARRFEHVISFPMPKAGERLRLWRSATPDALTLEGGLDLREIAEQAEISGGAILNVLRHAALKSATRGEAILRRADIAEGIRRELAKEGRSR